MCQKTFFKMSPHRVCIQTAARVQRAERSAQPCSTRLRERPASTPQVILLEAGAPICGAACAHSAAATHQHARRACARQLSCDMRARDHTGLLPPITSSRDPQDAAPLEPRAPGRCACASAATQFDVIQQESRQPRAKVPVRAPSPPPPPPR